MPASERARDAHAVIPPDAPPSEAHDPLSPEDYERMFRVVHGLLLAEQCDPAKACLYFGVIGALLIQQHHHIRAQPVVGMAGYRLAGRPLVFAEPEAGILRATPTGFHCWIDTPGFVIDLQAPLFPEAVAQRDPTCVIPRRMMQQPFARASDTPQALGEGGTHWHYHDAPLHQTLLTEFVERQVNQDLAQIAGAWYRPSPAPMREATQVGNGRGQVKTAALSTLRVAGRW